MPGIACKLLYLFSPSLSSIYLFNFLFLHHHGLFSFAISLVFMIHFLIIYFYLISWIYVGRLVQDLLLFNYFHFLFY